MNNFQRSVNSEMKIPRPRARMVQGVTRRVRIEKTPRVGSISFEMKMYAEQLIIKLIEVMDKKPDDNIKQFTGLLAYRPLELLYFTY